MKDSMELRTFSSGGFNVQAAQGMVEENLFSPGCSWPIKKWTPFEILVIVIEKLRIELSIFL